jgi:hypothetical protein
MWQPSPSHDPPYESRTRGNAKCYNAASVDTRLLFPGWLIGAMQKLYSRGSDRQASSVLVGGASTGVTSKILRHNGPLAARHGAGYIGGTVKGTTTQSYTPASGRVYEEGWTITRGRAPRAEPNEVATSRHLNKSPVHERSHTRGPDGRKSP